MRTASGRFRSSDVSRAQTFRRAQLITGITSVLLYAASIVEGQLNFRSQIELNTERLKNGQVSPVSGLGFTFEIFSTRFMIKHHILTSQSDLPCPA